MGKCRSAVWFLIIRNLNFFLYLGDTQNLFGRFQTIPNLVKISLLEMREDSDSDSQSRTMGQIGMSLYRHRNMEYHDTVSLKTRLFFFFF